MPIDRYTEFQKNTLIETGIGSGIESINNRFSKLHSFLAHAQIEDAKKEAENMHYCFFMTYEGINVQAMSFACMIHSINGEVRNDFSEDGLRYTVSLLNKTGISVGLIEEQNEELKKKSLTS